MASISLFSCNEEKDKHSHESEEVHNHSHESHEGDSHAHAKEVEHHEDDGHGHAKPNKQEKKSTHSRVVLWTEPHGSDDDSFITRSSLPF